MRAESDGRQRHTEGKTGMMAMGISLFQCPPTTLLNTSPLNPHCYTSQLNIPMLANWFIQEQAVTPVIWFSRFDFFCSPPFQGEKLFQKQTCSKSPNLEISASHQSNFWWLKIKSKHWSLVIMNHHPQTEQIPVIMPIIGQFHMLCIC